MSWPLSSSRGEDTNQKHRHDRVFFKYMLLVERLRKLFVVGESFTKHVLLIQRIVLL